MLTRQVGLLFALCSCLSLQQDVSASVFVPSDLAAGDSYHLAFVTEGKRDGASPFIEDYNAFVNSEATRPGAITADYGIQWFAMASTHLVDARANAPVLGAVYLVDGTRIASGVRIWLGEITVPFAVTQFAQSRVRNTTKRSRADSSAPPTRRPLWDLRFPSLDQPRWQTTAGLGVLGSHVALLHCCPFLRSACL